MCVYACLLMRRHHLYVHSSVPQRKQSTAPLPLPNLQLHIAHAATVGAPSLKRPHKKVSTHPNQLLTCTLLFLLLLLLPAVQVQVLRQLHLLLGGLRLDEIVLAVRIVIVCIVDACPLVFLLLLFFSPSFFPSLLVLFALLTCVLACVCVRVYADLNARRARTGKVLQPLSYMLMRRILKGTRSGFCGAPDPNMHNMSSVYPQTSQLLLNPFNPLGRCTASMLPSRPHAPPPLSSQKVPACYKVAPMQPPPPLQPNSANN